MTNLKEQLLADLKRLQDRLGVAIAHGDETELINAFAKLAEANPSLVPLLRDIGRMVEQNDPTDAKAVQLLRKIDAVLSEHEVKPH
jgi:hypothetical protein